MDQSVFDAVKKVLDNAERYAVLFIGSGLSRRYLGTPSWVGLLELLSDQVLGDELAFSRAKYRAMSSLGLDTSKQEDSRILPVTAKILAKQVDDAILSPGGSKRLEVFRTRYHDELVTGAVSPTKLYVSDYFKQFNLSTNPEAELLKHAAPKISSVITTNYDHLCEQLFPKFVRFIGQRELIFAEPTFESEIYKIHGSCDEPNGIVLTSDDYKTFSAHEAYLVAKLLTIFMEHPIIFLGYSISDPNIQDILESIAECVGPSDIDKIKERMVFVEYKEFGDSEVNEVSFAFKSKMIAMTRIQTNDYSSIYRAISESTMLYRNHDGEISTELLAGGGLSSTLKKLIRISDFLMYV